MTAYFVEAIFGRGGDASVPQEAAKTVELQGKRKGSRFEDEKGVSLVDVK
jgi:hypothetical protein